MRSMTFLALAWLAQSQAGFAAGQPPAAADVAAVDRFSDQAGHLFRRSANPALPAANAPVDFDQGPFITLGIGPQGDDVSYYNFDVMPTVPASIYVLFKAGAAAPVEGQLNLVDAVPGDPGYSDFWNVVKVTVPDSYTANDITSVADLLRAGFTAQATTAVVNCPIVPAGSTARLRYNANADTGLHRGWYRNKVVSYFNFSERALTLAGGAVPLSDIYVTFNKNPAAGDPASGPASGFVTEAATGRTHNVIQTVPEDAGYSPLWDVNVYNNTAFGAVHDLATAFTAPLLASSVAQVNCPVVARTAKLPEQ